MKSNNFNHQNFLSKFISKNEWSAVVILIIGFFATIIITFFVFKNVKKQAQEEFTQVCTEIEMNMDTRLHAHALLLRTGAAFFSVADTITRKEWKKFVDNSKIEKNLPGIQGVGFSLIIPKNLLEEHIRRIQGEGFTNYRVYPAGNRDVYTSIVYLEPFSYRNRRAMGYDMYSDSTRRKAMDASRDYDIAMLSGKVALVQETNEDVQFGTLMYVPVYKSHMPISTIEERRAAIKGWVYSPYRMNDLMKGILGRWDKMKAKRIHLKVYDDVISANSLLYDSQINDTIKSVDTQFRTHSIPIEFNGKKWLLSFSQPNPQFSAFNSLVISVLISGLVISFLLFLLTKLLFNSVKRSYELAEKLTIDIKRSEEKYHSDFNLLHSIIESPTKIIIFALDRSYQYTSFSKFHKETMKTIWGADIQIGMSILDVISRDDDKEGAKQNFEKALNGESFIVTEEYGDDAGQRTFYENYYSAIKNSDGEIVGVSVFVIDISQRLQAEHAQFISEKKYNEIFEQSPVAIKYYDSKGILVNLNSAAIRLFGIVNIQEVMGTSLFDIHILTKMQKDKLLKRESIYFEYEFDFEYIKEHNLYESSRSGKITLDCSISPLTSGDLLIGYVARAQDISERKKSEAILNDSEIRYRRLFETAQDGIIILDADTGKIVMVNPFLVQMLGYTEEQFIEKAIWEIGTFKNITASHEKFLELKQQNYVRYENLPLETSKGEIIEVEFVSNVYLVDQKKVIQCNIRDVSERKKAQLLLQQTRQNYETFFNTIDNYLFVLDQNANIVHTNKTVIERLGYSEDEICGQSVLKLHPKGMVEDAKRIFGEMLLGKTDFCPIPLVTKAGEQILVETRINHGIWNGQPVIFGVSKDMTQIRLSEEKFSKVFYLNPSACSLSEQVTEKYTEVNAAFYSVFGFTSDEVIGKTAVDLGIINNQQVAEIYQKSDKNGNISDIELALKAKNGEIKYVILSSENISLFNKKMRYTVVHDISKRKLYEEQLFNKQLLLRTLIDNIPDAIYAKDAQLRKTLANPTELIYMKAKSEEEVLGKTDFETYPLEFSEKYDIDDQKVIKTGQPLNNCEGFIYDDKNQKRWLLSSKIPLRDKDGKIIGLVGISRDITQRKKSEIDIKTKNEELQKLNAEKDKFFSIIAHDLKSPFNSILGFSEILVEHVKEKDYESIEKYAEIIHLSSTRAMDLLTNIMEWSRSQTGRMEFNPGYFEMVELIKTTIEFFTENAGQKSIIITKELPSSALIFADKDMISTVLRNLISNAIKFTHVDGEIHIGAQISKEILTVSVSDNGVGISQENIEKLFRIDGDFTTTGTQNEKGTGLGLILCKEFVEKHGGKIWVESRVDELEDKSGSTFYFTIPKNNLTV